jgi:hypothetical protein
MTGLTPSSTDARIRETLESLYRTFAAPCPPRIEGCPCCISTRNVDVLLATPLRELGGKMLWRYVTGAFLTIGGESDFRYFLPRILDISVNDPGDSPDLEIVLGKLRLANWRSWPAAEQRLIEELVDAWFERALERDLSDYDEYEMGHDAESVMCGAASAGIPLDRWLVRLQEADARPVLDDLKKRFPGGLSAFWEDAPEGLRQLSTTLLQGQA